MTVVSSLIGDATERPKVTHTNMVDWKSSRFSPCYKPTYLSLLLVPLVKRICVGARSPLVLNCSSPGTFRMHVLCFSLTIYGRVGDCPVLGPDKL